MVFNAERFAAGDREHARDVMREFGPLARGVCRAYAECEDHADDLVQETWLAVARRAVSYRGEGSFAGWLRRVATNVCLSDARRRSAHRRFVVKYVAMSEPEGRHDPQTALDQRERRRLVADMLTTLSEREREVLVLCELEGCSTSEAAELLGVSEATVRSHKRHAIRRLRAVLRTPHGHPTRVRFGAR
ncbi:MAG: sigma-70 family RNA polymerase sigma factor [Gemmatimonadota bacterium]